MLRTRNPHLAQASNRFKLAVDNLLQGAPNPSSVFRLS
jgi:hypothetical protein